MSSTNVFTGMAAERNSSRVLKPPGGGQTDILGLKAAPEGPKEKKINPRNISSIIEGTDRAVEKPAVVEPPSVAEKTPVTQDKPEVVNNGSAPRTRVPPGGFSSGGFW